MNDERKNCMSYKALYLKYRPQNFDEVAGQKPIVRTLKNALATERIAHAYLFAGPRGTGKTTMARLFAKALNCEEGLGHQCDKCSNCLAITEGTHPDVIEIDAASNNGVDQVRELIDGVRYSPIKGKYKIYIIDEVHMMSTGAFNALLKTIEEPPENVIFILCTTEPFKVLPTVLSRCQRFDFAKLSEEEMGDKLKEVLENEGVTYNEEALKAIISLADGGMRDALSILDQVLAYSGNSINEKDILSVYGLASKEEKISLLTSLAEGDVSKVIDKSESYIGKGLDIRRLLLDLIDLLKDLLIFEKTNREDLMAKLNKAEALSLAKQINPDKANRFIKELLEAQNNFKNVSDIRSLFELTILSLASNNGNSSTPKKEIEISPTKPASIEDVPQEKEDVPQEKKVEEKKKEEIKPLFSKKEEKIKEPIIEEKKEETIASNKVPDWLWDDKQEEVKTETTSKAFEETPSIKKEEIKEPTIEEEKEKIKEPIQNKNEEIKEKEDTPSLDTSKILRPQIATTGERFSLKEEDILNIMVLGISNKDERRKLVENWHKLDSLKLDPKFGALASLLSNGSPYCLSKEAILLAYKFTSLAEKANLVANQLPLSELLATLLGRKVFIYALDNRQKVDIQSKYFQLMQLNQLPSKDSIKLNLPK